MVLFWSCNSIVDSASSRSLAAQQLKISKEYELKKKIAGKSRNFWLKNSGFRVSNGAAQDAQHKLSWNKKAMFPAISSTFSGRGEEKLKKDLVCPRNRVVTQQHYSLIVSTISSLSWLPDSKASQRWSKKKKKAHAFPRISIHILNLIVDKNHSSPNCFNSELR